MCYTLFYSQLSEQEGVRACSTSVQEWPQHFLDSGSCSMLEGVIILSRHPAMFSALVVDAGSCPFHTSAVDALGN
jgi:hypothetical protein